MSDYYVSLNDPATAKEVAERYGFCHVKGVFSPAEMMSLERDLAFAHLEFEGKVPDLYSTPSLQWLLFDERIRSFAHALMGEKLVYYRETNAAYEHLPGPLTTKPFNVYHCDARGNSAALSGAPIADGIYPAYRFGIYFRNYRDHSGGLKVAPGSHLRDYGYDASYSVKKNVAELSHARLRIGSRSYNIRVPPMEIYNVPSVPGDLVIFNLRCFHSAGAIRLADRPNLALLPMLENLLPIDLCLPPPIGTRNAIFLDYGAPKPALDYYIKWRAVTSIAAETKVRYTYGLETPDWLLIRDDKVIALLAHKIVQERTSTSKDESDLVALCKAHREFAPEHALFDKLSFEANLSSGSSNTAQALAQDIVQRVQAHIEFERNSK